MSKQSKAKDTQGYDPKPQPAICSRCAHYQSEKKLPAWMEQAKADGEKHWHGRAYSIELDGIEGNLRCGLGGFAIKKTATCQKFERKDSA